MTENERIKLLKLGRAEELKALQKEGLKEEYPLEFREFMDMMIDEKGVKRKEIALRSGLSQDFLYKLLRGDKRTTERDYIIAICMALGLTLAQTQHALKIYGMPTLNKHDLRSCVIIMEIEERKSIDDLNALLEKNHFPYLRTSPDMEHAEIQYFGEVSDEKDAANHHNKATEQVAQHEYEEISHETGAEKCGPGSLDYSYWGRMIVEDESGNQYMVEAVYGPEGNYYGVMKEENAKVYREWLQGEHDEIEEFDFEEQYDSLEDTKDSDFFRWFIELDTLTDKEVIETLIRIDDTRNYGVRLTATLNKGEWTKYIEAFDTANPEERRYLQIKESADEIVYSASHESYFLRYELGELYEAYYGDAKPPEYYICTSDRQELRNKDIFLSFAFDELLQHMHERFAEEGLTDISTEDIKRESVRVLMQRAVALRNCGKDKEAIPLLKECLDKFIEDNDIVPIICTYNKLYHSWSAVGDKAKANENLQKCVDYAPELKKLMDDGVDVQGAAPSVAEGLLFTADRLQRQDLERGVTENIDKVKEMVLSCIDILEGGCDCENDWIILFQAYQKYGFIIDSVDAEKSLEYTIRAIEIARDQNLVSIDGLKLPIAILYNNHAWVLWNKLGSEEAIIYYGQCIDLLEGYLRQGSVDEKEAKAMLARVGTALLELYENTGKTREADNLRKRLRRIIKE